MGTIYRNGVPFVGSGGAGGVEMTEAEYELLPESEKMNGAIYFITDGDVSYPSASQMRYDNTESQIPSTTVQGAIDELKIDVDEINNGLTDLSEAVPTLASGWTQTQNRVQKRAGVCELYIECIFSGTYSSGWNTLATLPEGYRPRFAFDTVQTDNANDSFCGVKIASSGDVQVYSKTGLSKNLRIHATYLAGN